MISCSLYSPSRKFIVGIDIKCLDRATVFTYMRAIVSLLSSVVFFILLNIMCYNISIRLNIFLVGHVSA